MCVCVCVCERERACIYIHGRLPLYGNTFRLARMTNCLLLSGVNSLLGQENLSEVGTPEMDAALNFVIQVTMQVQQEKSSRQRERGER